MKTAVEWLVEQLDGERHLTENEIKRLIQQAKEIEKEQIINAYDRGHNEYDIYRNGQNYYNETYKTKTIVTEFRDGSVKVETFKSE
jgi:hypothetical protein